MTQDPTPSLEPLHADLHKAGKSISEILTDIENRYGGEVSVELNGLRHVSGERNVLVKLSIEIKGGNAW